MQGRDLSSSVETLQNLLDVPIQFKKLRRQRRTVYHGSGSGADVRIRIGNFPEEAMYIAWLASDSHEEFEIDLPKHWRLTPDQPLYK